MKNNKKLGLGLFTDMSREDFIKLLDEYGIEHRPTNGIGHIEYDDRTVECFLEGKSRKFDSIEEFDKECKRLNLIN